MLCILYCKEEINSKCVNTTHIGMTEIKHLRGYYIKCQYDTDDKILIEQYLSCCFKNMKCAISV
jgi:hypothetical protein